MDKKKIARMFVESFKTDIKEVELSGELKGTGGTVETTGHGEVIFGNYASYEKREFSRDYKNFAKKLGEEYGIDWHKIKKPVGEKRRCKSFYYQWDPVQIIEVDGIKFRMGRKMINMPHAIQDGCSHTYYININDFELLEEVKKLNDERLAKLEAKKKENFPHEQEDTVRKCKEMLEVLQGYCNGEYEIDEEAVKRINEAHFEVCVMLNG